MYTNSDGFFDAGWGGIDMQVRHRLLIPKEVLAYLLPVCRFLDHVIRIFELG
jgi:hypothetical protein